jgi:uroporphyrinogen-III decarboxylase
MNDRYLMNGGMFVPFQELAGPDAAQEIDAYVRTLFASLGARKSRVLFATGCNWSPIAPVENLIAFRDAVRRYGNLS